MKTEYTKWGVQLTSPVDLLTQIFRLEHFTPKKEEQNKTQPQKWQKMEREWVSNCKDTGKWWKHLGLPSKVWLFSGIRTRNQTPKYKQWYANAGERGAENKHASDSRGLHLMAYKPQWATSVLTWNSDWFLQERKGVQLKELLLPFEFSLKICLYYSVGLILSSVLIFSPHTYQKTRYVQDNTSPRILQSVSSPHPELAHPILPSAMTSNDLPLWQGKTMIGFTRLLNRLPGFLVKYGFSICLHLLERILKSICSCNRLKENMYFQVHNVPTAV